MAGNISRFIVVRKQGIETQVGNDEEGVAVVMGGLHCIKRSKLLRIPGTI